MSGGDSERIMTLMLLFLIANWLTSVWLTLISEIKTIFMKRSNLGYFESFYCLLRWIPFFIAEVRRRDGSCYRAKSVFEFVLCIQSLVVVMRNVRHQFLKDPSFLSIRNALDNIMKKLQREGLGYNPKKADVVTALMENELWNGGHLGDNSPKQLLRTMVFILGINLGLRAGEHRNLRRGMFEVRLR